VDASTVSGQPALVERLAALADPDLVLDARLVGLRPDELDVDLDEVERALAGSFLAVRVRDRSIAPLPDDAEVPPPDTVLGALVLDLEARIAEAEADAAADPARAAAADLRDALRVARHLMTGAELTL
jgi:hypothetical protein